MKRFRLLGLAVAMAFCLPQQVMAWGSDGHRISGTIAQALLTPAASRKLNEIIPDANLADLSVFMDVYREALKLEVPGSDKWHYDNRSVCRESVAAQYCPRGDCASAKIPEYTKVISDEKATTEARAQAIKFILHMVADVHQPLHVADDDDLGGNRKLAIVPGAEMPRNLHSMWDTELVKRILQGRSVADVSKEWLGRFSAQRASWQLGGTTSWMNDTYAIGKNLVYGRLSGFACGQRTQDGKNINAALFGGTPWPATPVPLTASYVRGAENIIPMLVTRAGVRVAAVLNAALDPAWKAEDATVGDLVADVVAAFGSDDPPTSQPPALPATQANPTPVPSAPK